MRVFGSQIDVAARGAYRDAGDHHTFDEQERIAFHHHAVGESAAVAFIGVAHDVFLRGRRQHHRPPLDASGKARPAAPTQAGRGQIGDDVGAAHAQRPLHAFQPAMRAVIRPGHRIGHPAARERHPGLARQERRVLRPADPAGMRGALQHPRRQQARHIVGRHRPVADAAFRCLDLQQRLQPSHAARSVAHDHRVRAGGAQRAGQLVGPHGSRQRVAGHEQAGAHDTDARTASSRA